MSARAITTYLTRAALLQLTKLRSVKAGEQESSGETQGDFKAGERERVERYQATAASAAAHLLVLDGVERDVIAGEDDGAAGHVDAVGERLGGDNDAEKAATEQHLNGHAVLVLETRVVHPDAPTQNLKKGQEGML
eukprot:3179116-Rhodomonas_salina.7